MDTAFRDSCPLTVTESRSKSWWNGNLHSLRVECRKLYRRYKGSNTSNKNSKWEPYKAKRNEYQSEISAAKRLAWQIFCESIKDTTITAKIHKLLAKETPSDVGFLKKSTGVFTTTHEETARVLQDTHFPGNIDPAVEPLDTQAFNHSLWSDDSLGSIVSAKKFKWAIDSFLPYKSPGLDGIYPKMLQALGDSITPVLEII